MGSSAPQRRQKQPIFFSRFCLFCFPRQLSSYSLILHKLFRNFWSFSFSLGLLTKMKRRNFCTLSKKWLQVKILEISKGTKEHALLACIITTNSFIWLTLKLVHLQHRGELCFATLVQLEHKQEMQQHFSRLKILKKKNDSQAAMSVSRAWDCSAKVCCFNTRILPSLWSKLRNFCKLGTDPTRSPQKLVV